MKMNIIDITFCRGVKGIRLRPPGTVWSKNVPNYNRNGSNNSIMKNNKNENKSRNGSEGNKLTNKNEQQGIQKRCSTILSLNPQRISPKRQMSLRKMKELRRLCSRKVGRANTRIKQAGRQLTNQNKEKRKLKICSTTLSRTKMFSPRKRILYNKFCSRRVGRMDPKGEKPKGEKPKRKWEDDHEAQPPPPQPQPQTQEELQEPPPLVINMQGEGEAPTPVEASASAEGNSNIETGAAAGPSNEEKYCIGDIILKALNYALK